MRFQVFPFRSKNISALLQNHVLVFEALIFSQDILGKVHYASEINLIS